MSNVDCYDTILKKFYELAFFFNFSAFAWLVSDERMLILKHSSLRLFTHNPFRSP